MGLWTRRALSRPISEKKIPARWMKGRYGKEGGRRDVETNHARACTGPERLRIVEMLKTPAERKRTYRIERTEKHDL